MDENHQDKTKSKLTATEDNLSPLSSEDQKGLDRPQSNQMKTIKLRSGFFGYDKETTEYAPDGQLAKITKEYQPGKTFWDWLQLLIIPLVLASATIGFGLWQVHLNDVQHQQDQAQAQDQQRATILQTYIDNIQDLLLNHSLLKSKPHDDVAILAQARTLTALNGLDPERKGRLVQFLYEAELIGFADYSADGNPELPPHAAIINLSRANLSGANLSGADLSDNQNINQWLLDLVSTCKGAILPKGLSCHHNQ